MKFKDKYPDLITNNTLVNDYILFSGGELYNYINNPGQCFCGEMTTYYHSDGGGICVCSEECFIKLWED